MSADSRDPLAVAVDRYLREMESLHGPARPHPVMCPGPACGRDVSHAHWSDGSVTYGGSA